MSIWNSLTPCLSYIWMEAVKEKSWSKIRHIFTTLTFCIKPLPTVLVSGYCNSTMWTPYAKNTLKDPCSALHGRCVRITRSWSLSLTAFFLLLWSPEKVNLKVKIFVSRPVSLSKCFLYTTFQKKTFFFIGLSHFFTSL